MAGRWGCEAPCTRAGRLRDCHAWRRRGLGLPSPEELPAVGLGGAPAVQSLRGNVGAGYQGAAKGAADHGAVRAAAEAAARAQKVRSRGCAAANAALLSPPSFPPPNVTSPRQYPPLPLLC